ncbi:helix-turn-helix domain-containing protein [Phyllobacterium ifriqiyense]|uniref:helix-turn-helix domain-containing protein n=1 Tax=Phyllobacterium ifriqiyense TaxID=314238 RepID=UPI003392D31A
MSPGQAYMKIRMERAKNLLIQTRSPMIEIALDVGFDDPSHLRGLLNAFTEKRPRR